MNRPRTGRHAFVQAVSFHSVILACLRPASLYTVPRPRTPGFHDREGVNTTTDRHIIGHVDVILDIFPPPSADWHPYYCRVAWSNQRVEIRLVSYTVRGSLLSIEKNVQNYVDGLGVNDERASGRLRAYRFCERLPRPTRELG